MRTALTIVGMVAAIAVLLVLMATLRHRVAWVVLMAMRFVPFLIWRTGVGLSAVDIASAIGARVIAVSRSQERLDLATQRLVTVLEPVIIVVVSVVVAAIVVSIMGAVVSVYDLAL